MLALMRWLHEQLRRSTDKDIASSFMDANSRAAHLIMMRKWLAKPHPKYDGLEWATVADLCRTQHRSSTHGTNRMRATWTDGRGVFEDRPANSTSKPYMTAESDALAQDRKMFP
jgi:hypothetical protein